jgi:hypothetical protein
MIKYNISVFGDSHARSFNNIAINGANIDVNALSGATLTGLVKRISTLEVLDKIKEYINKNPNIDFLILKFGQVDIDLKFFYKKYVKQENISDIEYIQECVRACKVLIESISEVFPREKIVICGINPPTPVDAQQALEYTSSIILTNEAEKVISSAEFAEDINYSKRLSRSAKLNFELRSMCRESKIKYFEVFGEILDKNNLLNPLYIGSDQHIKGVEHDAPKKQHPINRRFQTYVSNLTGITNETLTDFSSEDVTSRYLDSHYYLCGTFKSYNKPPTPTQGYPIARDILQYDHILNIDIPNDIKRNLLNQFTLKEGDHVLELGAYIGLGARYLSKRVGTTGKVLSIEGIESNYDLLVENTSCCDNVDTYNTCISSEDTLKTLYTSSQQLQTNEMNKVHSRYGYGSVKPSQEFPVRSVDSLLENEFKEAGFSPTYITIELNLSEYDALVGMKKLLQSSNYMRIVVAAWYDEVIRNNIIEFLTDMGFKVFTGHYNRVYATKGLAL